MGYQQSLFYNKDNPEEENLEWNKDYTITNLKLGKTIKIGGDGIHNGSISYIANYGFYEGGKATGNSYRIEPEVYFCHSQTTYRQLLVEILSGKA
jgi:hypothetical protein